jgi:dTDP-4-dehydrorhamnose reductase
LARNAPVAGGRIGPQQLEIWASPEPTVARIDAATYRDQLEETGHGNRGGDYARLAMLDVDATRFPILWERTAPGDPAQPELGWARARLSVLEAVGIEPVVTLLHHGSGPAHTSLLDPQFPEKLAAYARAIAAAFPWIVRWTPINEPLTTARFSTLYGLWYPNRTQDDEAFGHALAHEVLGMLLAMEAIRESVPDASFVLTEDLQGFDALDAGIAEYVAHKRERRYLSVELAMGRVVEGHPLYRYLRETCGVAQALLQRIVDHAYAPDILGWNYYPNSERVLRSNGSPFGENLPRVVHEPGSISPRPLLREAHERLGLAFGLSEVHVNAGEAARVRWLVQRYDDLSALAEEGLPVRMLGAWAAFGLVDWDSLLTRRESYTEDGIFTFAGPGESPQPTAVADAIRALARGQRPELPPEPGWWETRGTP